jgi:hypothetical protein
VLDCPPAWSRVQLGTLAITGSRLEEARALFDEGLELSLAVRSTRQRGPVPARVCSVGVGGGRCGAGGAAGGRGREPAPAGRLADVADAPAGEAELVAQIREALGADRFEELFAAGARLNRRDAVAALRDRGGHGWWLS